MKPRLRRISDISRWLAASVLLCATLVLLAQPARAQFTQQGPKLVGTGVVGIAEQGFSVALSADGNTAIVGGYHDNGSAGAAWVFTRSGTAWTQQAKLSGTGAVGAAQQGFSVAISADGNTAIVGGNRDNSGAGAAWVFTRSGTAWTQQGGKLVGSGAVGNAQQGWSVAFSADGNTALLGGPSDNSAAGAIWVFTRSGTAWTQQGGKLVGTGATGIAEQGRSVKLSADGNTALVGGYLDNSGAGAAWVFTRAGTAWAQQGGKLVGIGATGPAGTNQGWSVALSADGDTALLGGPGDGSGTGAAWVFTRSGAAWSQQGGKLVGGGAMGIAQQGWSVALSADGDTALLGGPSDSSGTGATWVFTRSGTAWTQQGPKRVGSGATGNAQQGFSVALSADGDTALLGGPADNSSAGAAWVFVQSQSALQVSPATGIAAAGVQGQQFSPASFAYELSSSGGSVNYQITGTPTWLTPSFTSGTLPPTVSVTFTVNACGLASGSYSATIAFTNKGSGEGDTTRAAALTVDRATKDSCKNGGWKKFVCAPGPFKSPVHCLVALAKKR